MRRRFQRLHNVHAVIAAAAGVTLLVTGALAVLGWRLLSQEEALERQRQRDRLEQFADGVLAGVLRRLAESEARLAQFGVAVPTNPKDFAPCGEGAVLVLLRPTSIGTHPKNHLLFYPIAPAAQPMDLTVFEQSEKLEFQTRDYAAAASELAVLAKNQIPQVRAEAFLRLARVHSKRQEVSQALEIYSRLLTETLISQAEVPYDLLARFARCQLLKAPAKEAMELLADLESGRWHLRKESFAYYSAALRDAAGIRTGAELNPRLAVTQAVESLWAEWQLVQQGQTQPFGRRVYSSNGRPVLALVHSNAERLAAVVYVGEQIRRFALEAGGNDKACSDLAKPGVSITLADEQGRPTFGAAAVAGGIRTTRTLAAAQLPWQIQLAATSTALGGGVHREQRNYLTLGLLTICAIVGLACYAMARGLVRELLAARLQSDFVSAVSHEFRSPLTTLRQLTELLAHGRIHDESRRRLYFEVLQKETSRLHRLVENLLDFGRMEADRKQYSPEPLDLSEVVREGIREYQDEIHGSGYSFELSADAPFAPVEADREGLRRVVRNLLENAVKYSPDCRTVWVEAGREAGSAIFKVRDQGIGIAPQEQSRIFDKFVRGEAAKQACIQGTGIGLAMVKEIVKAHNGQVMVVSEVGKGSTFTVRLPLRAASNGNF